VSTRLVLIRHGRTEWNADGRFQGQADVPLDPIGRAQATALAPSIAALRPDAVVSSPLSRALETARVVAVASGLQVQLDPRLAEINVGTWAGKRTEDAAAELPAFHELLRTGQDFRRSSTGETASEAGARVAEALRRLAEQNPDGVTAVVGHGLAMRMAILDLVGLDMAAGLALSGLWNCSWSVLELRDRWRILSYNNVVADL